MDDPMGALVAVIVVGGFRCLMGWASSSLAKRRNRSPRGWFWAGFLLGWLGILIAACMSNLTPKVEGLPNETTIG